jgi:hypothetical protein
MLIVEKYSGSMGLRYASRQLATTPLLDWSTRQGGFNGKILPFDKFFKLSYRSCTGRLL